ncbi:MAG TPA: hypothetical protein VGE11_25220 [Pseudonocardia sp.]
MTHSSAGGTATSTAAAGLTRALSVVATLSVLMIVLQGVTAGQILSRNRGAEALHFSGAIVVHVLTGLTAVVAILVARRDRDARWPAGLAVVVFIVGFIQAAVGEAGLLAVHVPLAMLLVIGAATVMVWSLRWIRA